MLEMIVQPGKHSGSPYICERLSPLGGMESLQTGRSWLVERIKVVAVLIKTNIMTPFKVFWESLGSDLTFW